MDRYVGIAGGSIEDYAWNRYANGTKERCTNYITSEIADRALEWVRDREGLDAVADPVRAAFALRGATAAPAGRRPDRIALWVAFRPAVRLASIEAMDRELARFFQRLPQDVREQALVLFLRR
ncbi:MAG: hypothetical protein R2810_09295 [Flavobacteriales bacterium]